MIAKKHLAFSGQVSLSCYDGLPANAGSLFSILDAAELLAHLAMRI